MATIDEIKQQAEAVKNASHVGENTALRVGGVLVGLCECMKNLSGGGTSGGSGVSLGTLLTKLNSENPFPTASGQVLTYDGSNFIWKAPTGSGGGTSSTLYPFTIYNGSSDNDYITYDGSSAAYLKFKSGFSISKVGLGYEISATGSSGSGVTLSPVMSQMNKYLTKTTLNTPQFLYWDGTTYTWKNESEIGGGSGGSGSRINKIKLFNSLGQSFDEINLGTANTIGFMQGDNVTLQAVVEEYTNVIKISASGGSGSGSSGGSVSWTDVTNKPSTFTPSSHTHSTSDINGLDSYVKGTKVSNASAADRLANAVTLWGNSFSGNNSIGTTSNYADLRYVKNIYASSTFDIEAGSNSLLKVDGTQSIYVGFGYMANNKASLYLFGNKTTIYTSGDDYRYDFTKNIFDVNSNSIHFGSETNGGKISWDADNNAFKIDGNVYATGGITALGVSNSAITSNNLDFTFKSVTANTFNVKDSIQLSDSLVLNRDGDDVYLANTDSAEDHYIYLNEDESFCLSPNGDGFFNHLSCTTLDVPGAEHFQIYIEGTTFTIEFVNSGKKYKFTPSEGNISIS